MAPLDADLLEYRIPENIGESGTNAHLHPLHPVHVGTDARSRRLQESRPPHPMLPPAVRSHPSVLDP